MTDTAPDGDPAKGDPPNGDMPDGDVHFIQRSDGPVFVGPGPGTLSCRCGNRLINGYDPARFLSVGLRCGVCGTLTTTPPLPAGTSPPFAVIIAEPIAEPRSTTTTLPAHAFVIGRAEMDRISALYRPAPPPDPVYRFSPALLDSVVETYRQLTGTPPHPPPGDHDELYAGLKTQPLLWAIGHLQRRMQQPAWQCMDDIATPIAVVHTAGLLHFVATWQHHPLFPAMVARLAADRFSVHGLALFAAAHCASNQGNRIGFPAVSGDPPQVEGFVLATGPVETLAVHVEPFNRFEVPVGAPWTPALLRAAVSERIAASQGRINLRNPGLLVLSPGAALAGFDEALIVATQEAMQALGRRHRGLMATIPIVLRLQRMPDPHAVRFGYGFFPVPNRHYEGDGMLQAAG